MLWNVRFPSLLACVIWLDCTSVTFFFISCYWTPGGAFFAKPILFSCAAKTAECSRLYIHRIGAIMCIRKAIEPHSSSRLVICRIHWLLVQICVVDDTFIACQNVPKGCVLVLVLLQHTTSRHVDYTQNLSSTEAVRTIYPLLTRPCAMLISRHCPRLRLIQFIRANSMEKSPSWKANSSSASQKFPAFPGTRRFISAFTTARHLFLSWTRSIHSMPPRFKSWRSYLSLGFPSGLFLSGLFTKTLYTPIVYPIRATCPAYAILLDFITWIISGEEYRS